MDLSGIIVGKKIREELKDYSVKIVFISNSMEEVSQKKLYPKTFYSRSFDCIKVG